MIRPILSWSSIVVYLFEYTILIDCFQMIISQENVLIYRNMYTVFHRFMYIIWYSTDHFNTGGFIKMF